MVRGRSSIYIILAFFMNYPCIICIPSYANYGTECKDKVVPMLLTEHHAIKAHWVVEV
jgi:hypothetical protein